MLQKLKCYVCDEENCKCSTDTSNSIVCENAILLYNMDVDKISYKTKLISTLQNLFKRQNPFVKKLMGLTQTDEDSPWGEKVIEFLVKKLKKKRISLDDLLYAVSHPDSSSKCVTLPRSVDAKLKILELKSHPHVIFCRLWRWADLQSHHEIRNIDNCKYPFSKRNTEICMNPYHYRRLENPNLRPIMVQKVISLPPNSPPQTYLQSKVDQRRILTPNVNLKNSCTASNISEYNYCNFPPELFLESLKSLVSSVNSPPSNTKSTDHQTARLSKIIIEKTMMVNKDMNNTDLQFNLPHQETKMMPNEVMYTNDSQFNLTDQKREMMISNGVMSSNVHQLNLTEQERAMMMVNECMNNKVSQFELMKQEKAMMMSNGVTSNNVQPLKITEQKIWDAYRTPESTPIPYEEPYHWALISYYELNNRVGETFRCKPRVITVDGYTNPNLDSDRFCLGSLSNLKRYEMVEKTRRHIGRGIQLHYVNGMVLVDVHCERSVFIQSLSCNKQNNFNLSSVIKLSSGTTFKAFDNAYFNYLLEEGVKRGSFEEIYKLITMCTIRVSFVKGWGANYHRYDATDTPCWIEIHLNGPLKWLDNVLNSMGRPMGSICIK